MTEDAYFQVNPQLARLLGETYRSSEAALKELVDNAWDADAKSVKVTLPAPMTDQPIVIEDDGSGMSEQAIRKEYLNIASDKRKRIGEISPILGRKIKGRKGIGKFAGLAVAALMTVRSNVDGQANVLEIDKKDIIGNEKDLETIPLRFDTGPNLGKEMGTKITLEALDQRLNFPTEEKLRELLVREYGREFGFKIIVNGAPLTVEDVPGKTSQETKVLPSAGKVDLNFTVSDQKTKPKSPGISLKVGGKVIGAPTFFDLDKDEEIPRKLLKTVYGEVEVPENDSFVNADWNSMNESSKAFQEVKTLIQTTVKTALQDAHSQQMHLQKARLKKEIDRRLAKLPENRREFADKALHKILQRFYGESDEKIRVIAEVALDAMELDAYWTVLDKINDASTGDVFDFASSLQDFGLLELANIRKQAEKRRLFLDHLEALSGKTSTREQEMHVALEKSLWVFGERYSLMSSNQTLKNIVSDFCDRKFKGERAENRPDLLLTQGWNSRYLLVEFKRPSKVIGRIEISQAEGYRDELSTHLSSEMSFEICMVGKKRDPKVSVDSLPPSCSVHSYLDLISTSHAQIDWLVTTLQTQ